MPRKQPTARNGVTPPQLPPSLPITALPERGLVDHGVYNDLILAQADLAGQSAQAATFETVQFDHVRLGGTRLAALHLRDVRFDTCDCADAAWEQAQVTRIEVLASRLVGFQASEARLQDALFQDCTAPLALFWGTTFTRVRFQTCALGEASFYEADLSGVVFDRCDLRGADLRGATLRGTDFRGSQVEGLQVEGCDLRGVVIDPTQAVVFASLLGLVVHWDD